MFELKAVDELAVVRQTFPEAELLFSTAPFHFFRLSDRMQGKRIIRMFLNYIE